MKIIKQSPKLIIIDGVGPTDRIKLYANSNEAVYIIVQKNVEENEATIELRPKQLKN